MDPEELGWGGATAVRAHAFLHGVRGRGVGDGHAFHCEAYRDAKCSITYELRRNPEYTIPTLPCPYIHHVEVLFALLQTNFFL